MSAEEFKKQYLPYQEKLYRIAFRLLENSFDAEDIVQDAYVKLWNKRDDLNNIENKEAFCIIMVRNLCMDFLRSNKKHITQSLTGSETLNDNIPLSEQIDAKSDLEHVKYLVNFLPDQQKNVLILKHYDGYSLEEIEDITGLKNVHIRVLLSRARKKIRESFIDKQQ